MKLLEFNVPCACRCPGCKWTLRGDFSEWFHLTYPEAVMAYRRSLLVIHLPYRGKHAK